MPARMRAAWQYAFTYARRARLAGTRMQTLRMLDAGASVLVELCTAERAAAVLPVDEMLLCAIANLPLALNESEV